MEYLQTTGYPPSHPWSGIALILFSLALIRTSRSPVGLPQWMFVGAIVLSAGPVDLLRDSETVAGSNRLSKSFGRRARLVDKVLIKRRSIDEPAHRCAHQRETRRDFWSVSATPGDDAGHPRTSIHTRTGEKTASVPNVRILLDLFLLNSQLNVYAGQSQVRPPAAPTIEGELKNRKCGWSGDWTHSSRMQAGLRFDP